MSKIALLAAIVAVAAGNRRRIAGLAPDDLDAPRRLRRSLRAEVAFAVLVLAATATLARAAPPATIAGGLVVRE